MFCNCTYKAFEVSVSQLAVCIASVYLHEYVADTFFNVLTASAISEDIHHNSVNVVAVFIKQGPVSFTL